MDGITHALRNSVFVAGLLIASAAQADGRMYMVDDIGALGGEQSEALALNASGTVVGWAETGDPGAPRHAFAWKDGAIIDLSTLGGPFSEARGINDAGVVVGTSTESTNEARAFLWRDGNIYDLNKILRLPFDGPEPTSIFGPIPCSSPLRLMIEANAINDAGWIVGCGYVYSDDAVHGIVLIPDDSRVGMDDIAYTYADLGQLPEARDCLAYDVNEFDQVVGRSGDRAFLWESGDITPLEYLTKSSAALGIARSGAVVGRTSGSRAWPMACMWRAGFRFDLTVESGGVSEALDINASEIIVGWAAADPAARREAVLWEGCVAVLLNDQTLQPVRTVMLPFDHLLEAKAINDDGLIVGAATLGKRGNSRAFILYPVGPDTGD